MSSVKTSKPKEKSPRGQKASRMSDLAQSMAEKLKDKPRKSQKPIEETKKTGTDSESIKSTAESTVEPKTMSPKKTQTQRQTYDTKTVVSTVSVSPQKKAAALRPTDDTMSTAMGPMN